MTLVSLGGHITLPPAVAGISGSNATTLDAAGEYAGFVIKIPKTGTLKKIAFRTYTVTTADTINVRIETVDEATGYPTGTLYDANGTGAQSSPAANQMYWVAINGSSGISVTAGDIVAIKFILDYVDGNLRIGYQSGAFASTLFPYYFYYTGGTYGKGGSSGIILALEYDGEIVPIEHSYCWLSTSLLTWNNTDTPDRRGLKITLPFTCRATGIWAYVDPDGACSAILYDGDGASVIETVTFPDADIRATNGAGLCFIPFSTPRTLVKDTAYRIVFLPTTSTDFTAYKTTFTDDGSLLGISTRPLGQNACYTTCHGTPTGAGSWTDVATETIQCGLLIDAIDTGSAGGFIGRRMLMPM